MQGCFVLASYGNKSHEVGLPVRKIGFEISYDEIADLARHYKKALPISY